MDAVDIASELEEGFRAAAIKAHLQPAPAGVAAPQERRHCRSCGGVIPKARQAANPQATRCTACETKQERSLRHYNHR